MMIFKNVWPSWLLKHKFVCSVCGKKIDKFIPLDSYHYENATKFGYKYFGQGETINLENYLCPICGATDRERLFSLFINNYVLNKKLSGFTPNKLSLLHIAPDKALSKILKNNEFFNYRSADLFMQEADDKIDITDLKIYRNDSFDCFICSHVLEHVIEDRKALSELYRILKRDGWGILMVPIIPTLKKTYEDNTKTTEDERWRFFGQGDHVRLYAKNDFISLMQQAGFVVTQYDVSSFGAEIFVKHAISLKSVLYVVRK